MAAKNFFNDAVVGQTDMFSMFGLDEAEQVAESTAETTDAVEAEDNAAEEDGDESEKKSASKPVKTPSGKKDMEGPVEVLGCGWNATVGEQGKKYSAKQVARLVYEAGYREVAAAGLKYKGNTLYVSTVSERASDDALSCKGGVTVILGQAAASITAEACNMSDDELSLFDVCEKFTSLVPEFSGCSLKLNASAGVAVPVFDKKIEAKSLDGNKEYSIWHSDGVKTMTGADITTFYEDYVLYESSSGTIFAMPAAPSKGKEAATSFTVKAEDLGLTEKKEEKVKEIFTLPMKICLSNYNQVFEVTGAEFGGKEKVDREDVLNYLRPQYRAFRSSSRKFDFCYNKQSGELAVMIMSGEKGAATAAAFSLPATINRRGVRVENTPVGLFKGRTDINGDVSSLDFKFGMDKIPFTILFQIIALFRADLTRECVVQILWNEDEGYYIREVAYDATKTYLKYEPVPGRDVLVMTVHSHNTMRAIFSRTDDNDEIYTGLFGVIGCLGPNSRPEMSFRAGMEGCFKGIPTGHLFGGAVG